MRKTGPLLGVLTSSFQVAFSASLLFVLYRLVKDTVGLERFGAWSSVMATAGFIALGELGFCGGTLRHVARTQAQQQPRQAAVVVETAFLTIVGVMALLCLLTYPLLQGIVQHTLAGESGALREEALRLLPWALGYPLLTVVSNVSLSALDGLHQVHLRGLLASGCYLLFAALVVLFVPRFGIVGIGMAQVVQFSAQALGAWVLLRRHLPGLKLVPRRWSRPIARQLLREGMGWQAIAGFNVLAEPLTKLLVMRFGGAAFAGHFEFAHRVALQVRNLAVAAQQALLPMLTRMATLEPDRMAVVYARTMRLTLLLVLVALPLAWLAAPAGAWLWMGHPHRAVTLLLQGLASAALLSALANPAYFDFAGRGTLAPNIAALATMAALNALLGLLGGTLWGGWGAAGAYGAALVAGSAVLPAIYAHRFRVPLRAFAGPREALSALAVAVALAVIVRSNPSASGVWPWIAAMGCTLGIGWHAWSGAVRPLLAARTP